MNRTTVWDYFIPLFCAQLLCVGVFNLLNGYYLISYILLPIGAILLSIRLGYSHYKDKQDAKLDDEQDKMLDVIITKLGITPDEIEEERIKLIE